MKLPNFHIIRFFPTFPWYVHIKVAAFRSAMSHLRKWSYLFKKSWSLQFTIYYLEIRVYIPVVFELSIGPNVFWKELCVQSQELFENASPVHKKCLPSLSRLPPLVQVRYVKEFKNDHEIVEHAHHVQQKLYCHLLQSMSSYIFSESKYSLTNIYGSIWCMVVYLFSEIIHFNQIGRSPSA